MGGVLATVVAVRRTTDAGAQGVTLPGDDKLSSRITGGDTDSGGDIDVVAFATPTTALRAADRLVSAEPSVAVGVHVAELAGDVEANQPVVEVVRSLARQATAGEVLTTDVVTQLGANSEWTFVSRGLLRVGGRPMTVHTLRHGSADPRRPTFGRELELASINWLIDDLLRGSGRIVVFEGEAGIGKTHLAADAEQAARSAGVLVARATADELGHDRPGALAEALLGGLEQLRIDKLSTRPPMRRGDHQFVEWFTATVEMCAQEQPVMLVAEDLHWADDLSLRAIGALASRLAPLAAALLVSFRPSPRPIVLARLDGVLDAAGAEHHLLDPLDPEAVTSLVATLAGAPPGSRLRDRLLTTAGNPLFVIEMLNALGHEDALSVDGGVVDVAVDSIDLPDRLRDTALRRIRELPDRTVEVLQYACLLGSTCEVDALATITGSGPSSTVEDLLPAVDAGVLARIDETVRFRHDVIREAIVADLPPAVRREMHTEAGTCLARAAASPVQVARQLALGARAGDTTAVEWLERAACDVQVLDPSTTVDLLEEALALAPPGWSGSPRLRCSMIEPLAASGRVDAAVDQAESVLSGPLDPALRRTATNGLVSALATGGDLGAAAKAAERVAADPSTDAQQRLVFGCVASSLRIFVDGSIHEARRAAESALASGSNGTESAPDDELACWATHALGLAALAEGRYEESLNHFDEAGRLLQRREISDHGFLIPHLNAATAAAYLDDFEAFDRRRRDVMERCAARGEVGPVVIVHFGGAATGYVAGRWDDALAEVDAGLSLASETGADSMTIGLRAIAALIHTGRGKPDEADRHLDHGFELLDRGAHLFGVDLLVLARARRLEELGDHDGAAGLLAGFWDLAAPIALALQHRSLLPHVVRLAGPQLGSRLADLLGTADRAARNTPVPSTIAAAVRCRGLATRDADLLTETVVHLGESPRRVELAEACEESAAACFRADRPDEAAGLIDQAVAIWDELGACNHAARLDAMARAHGIRRRRSGPASVTHGWDSLSPKELEVVDLVAEGLSNPAIGERLYISRRTVESHLSHVFTKLGLMNRAQVAAAVVERRSLRRDP